MPKLRLQSTQDVTIELRAKNALTIAGAVLAGGLPGHERIIAPEPRTSASKIEFVVPGEKGAGYFLIARVPNKDSVSPNQRLVVRTVTQKAADGSSIKLPPPSANPKTSKLRSKTSSGDFRYSELIDLV